MSFSVLHNDKTFPRHIQIASRLQQKHNKNVVSEQLNIITNNQSKHSDGSLSQCYRSCPDVSLSQCAHYFVTLLWFVLHIKRIQSSNIFYMQKIAKPAYIFKSPSQCSSIIYLFIKMGPV